MIIGLSMRFALCLLALSAAAQDRRLADLEVGSKACAGCHAEIYRKYSATGMANSSGRIGSGGFRESFDLATFSDAHSGATYTISTGAEGYRLRSSRPAAGLDDERMLKWFIGSGHVGRSYVLAIGSSLFQAPVSYYSAPGKWDLSPGYVGRTKVDLTRQIETACLQCHASRLQLLPAMQNQFADPPFLEGGVSCERCHGPGKTHIARMTAKPRASSPGIVNPVKLEPARRESVCAQCHLTGAARIARAGRISYEPGRLLSDGLAVFVWSRGDSSHPTATSHYENLAQSACKKASGDRLWCATCHDPHDQPADAARASFYRSRCATCHAGIPCTESPGVRNGNGDDCAACHMPKAPSRTVDHLAFTDHTIPRRSRPGVAVLPPVTELVSFAGAPVTERDRALAYAAVAPQEPAVRSHAFTLLRQAEAKDPKDLAIASHLATFYDRMGDEEKALTMFSRIVDADPSSTTAAVNAGVYLVKRGRLEEAIALWRKALALNPALVGARLNLAVALYRSNRLADAETALAQTLVYDPDNQVARQLAAEIRTKR